MRGIPLPDNFASINNQIKINVMRKFNMILLTASIVLGCNNSKDLGKVAPDRNDHLYIDVHHMGKGKVTALAVAEAHKKDLVTEHKYGVQFLKYWVDEESGTVFCLSKSPGIDQIIQTHKEAHGLIPQEIHLVMTGVEAIKSGNKKLFLDVHELGPGKVNADAVAKAHMKDLMVQGKYNVNFLNYFVDEKAGMIYCLSESNSPDAVIATHTEAHGLIPKTVMEVKQGE